MTESLETDSLTIFSAFLFGGTSSEYQGFIPGGDEFIPVFGDVETNSVHDQAAATLNLCY